MSRFLFVCLAVISAAGLHAGDKVVGGPYVVNVTRSSATVMRVVEKGEVTVGTDPAKADKSAPVLQVEKTSFTGLKAGTIYYYKTPDGGSGSFRTAPAGAAKFEFLVYGDTRTRHDVHRRVMAAIKEHSTPEFAIHTGDLVENGADSAQWPIFFDIENDLLHKAAFFPALGNHERNNRQFYEFFDVGQPYYSFDWGTCHFIILNSDIGNAAVGEAAKEAFWHEETAWLEQDLEKSQKADMRFVAAHHPPFTAVSRRQGDNPQMTALVPLFEKYHVTAGFFGHDHNYQHYLKDGIHYFITGGGGAPLYDVDKPPMGITKKVASTEHFVVIDVDGKTAHVRAIATDGKLLDEAELK
ncbi:MAG TPA: metallophosphoesterase [Bryobacteraceae bacterium]|nr:metallophosphoesterase [Bryobacteraceae bacterium]